MREPDNAIDAPRLSVVVIGRNEGSRLQACLASVAAVDPSGFSLETLYVDTQSSDGSPGVARAAGARVIEIAPRHPCAAAARNAGWRAAAGDFILFLDGDTELHPDFPRRALEAIHDPDVAIVWGHRRESRPRQSVYVRVLDLDWIYPPGDSDFCGGDALVRRCDLEAVGGFDDSLIAGEEPELCRRLRGRGRRILHIDAPMTRHDLAISDFPAYWQRAQRAGHAYAEVSARFANTEDPLWRAESRRNLAQATLLLGAASLAVALAVTLPAALPVLAALALLTLLRSYRRVRHKGGDATTRVLYTLHGVFQQLPIAWGQLGWHLHRCRGRRRALFDYKSDRVSGDTRVRSPRAAAP